MVEVYCVARYRLESFGFVEAVGQLHGNKVNTTGKSRVSFDFRCVPVSQYQPTEARTINLGLAFAPGGYYAADIVT